MDYVEHGPRLYRELSEPFPDEESLNQAFDEFHAAVGDLRVKLCLPDIVVLAAGNYRSGGEEHALLSVSAYGDSGRNEYMLVAGLRDVREGRDRIYAKALLAGHVADAETGC